MCNEVSDDASQEEHPPRPADSKSFGGLGNRRQFLMWSAVALGSLGAAGWAATLPTPARAASTAGTTTQSAAVRPVTITSTSADANSAASDPAPTAQMREPDPLGGAGFGAPTAMSVWAHYDDDLLFAGSRLDEAIDAGHFVRTVFLTAGDAGKGDAYAAGRERGIRQAYNEMRGSHADWSSTTVTLDTGAIVTAWQPDDTDRITLIFFRLPDGNMNGKGFASTGYANLPKLANNTIGSLSDLDGTYSITWQQLIDSIAQLIQRFAPSSILTSVPSESQKWSSGDHPDHRTAGTITRAAWQQAGYPGDLLAYAIGYQTETYSANISGSALDKKIDTFRAYSANDTVVDKCTNHQTCLKVPRFGSWLQRQYFRSEPELWTQ